MSRHSLRVDDKTLYMIPKIIHYCWFGRNPLPESAIKCIESWKKFLPNYEIKELNEDNFDVNIIPYTKEAYEANKYAFVSDYARYWILYNYGGIYFDTDVEVIKPMDDIIAAGPYMGIEVEATPEKAPLINPGLGIGAPAGLKFYRDVLDYYQNLHFLGADGQPNLVTVVTHTTNVLVANGMRNENVHQMVAGINIYPRDYFNPLDDNTGTLNITDNTRSIHWYSKTWLNKKSQFKNRVTRVIHRYFGTDSLSWLKNIIKHR